MRNTHPVVRFDNTRTATKEMALLLAESKNEGFKAVSARQVTDERGSFWRVELWKKEQKR